MKNKIVLIVISLFLLCFGAKAQVPPLDPKATADPTAFSLRVGDEEEVSIYLTPYTGYMIGGLYFEIEGDTTGVEVTNGRLSFYTQTYTVKGLKPGRYEISIFAIGYQRTMSGAYPYYFALEIKLTITVVG